MRPREVCWTLRVRRFQSQQTIQVCCKPPPAARSAMTPRYPTTQVRLPSTPIPIHLTLLMGPSDISDQHGCGALRSTHCSVIL